MLRNNKGFFLAEAMVALLIITIVFSVSFPSLYKIQMEKMAIKETNQAINILQEQLIYWRIGQSSKPLQVFKDGQIYHLTWHDRAASHEALCIYWKGSSQRNMSRCAEGAK